MGLKHLFAHPSIPAVYKLVKVFHKIRARLVGEYFKIFAVKKRFAEIFIAPE